MTSLLFEDVTLLDCTGADPRPHSAVLVEDGRITRIDAAGAIRPADGARRIDGGGMTLMPGLTDAHVHFGLIEHAANEPPESHVSYVLKVIENIRIALDEGFTTVRDAGGADVGVKQAVEQGLVQGPRMQISITVLTITGGHGDGWMLSGNEFNLFPSYPGNPDGRCDGPEEVRKKVREVLRAGAEVIKVCSTGGVLSPTDHPEFTQFSLEELEIMVQEAHYRRGVKVMAHAQGSEGIKNAVRAGIHSIEHGIYLDDEAIELMLERGTFLVPTLVAPVGVLEAGERDGSMPEYGVRKAREVVDIHRASIAKAYKAGVKIAMGTDAAVVPHGTNLRELGLMCDAGMAPMDVIVAATRTAAECLGWQDRIGTLEAGKLADLIISTVDPLADMHALADNNKIALVIKDGQMVKNRLVDQPAGQAA